MTFSHLDLDIERRVILASGLDDVVSQLVTLPDPATAVPSQYLVVPATPTAPPSLRELNVFSPSTKPSYASWFGPGDTVIKDGHLYIFTPMHVNFLILPALIKIQAETPGTFCGLDHVIESMGEGASDAFGVLLGLLTHESQLSGIQRICDVKENADDVFVKLNEDKLLEWLKTRVERVRAKIQAEDVAFASCSDEEMQHYGISVVAEYVPGEVEAKLYAGFGLEKRKEMKAPTGGLPGPLDMPRVEHVEDRAARREELEAKKKQDAKDKAKAQREEDKARKRAKEVAGIPKISSFFTKKKK